MNNGQSPKTLQDAKIRGIAIWFYIIAALQVFSAVTSWQSGTDAAAAGAGFAVADLVIGALFVVLAYYASKKQPWAFVAGLVLYAARMVVNLFEFFSPIALVIRLFLMFRIWQGLQACLAANRADQAMAMMNQRRLVMPTSPAAPTEPQAAPAQSWRPAPYTPDAGASAEPAPVPQPWRPTAFNPASAPQANPETL